MPFTGYSVEGDGSAGDKGDQTGIIRVACVGNSVTYGYGLRNREVECYPAVLQSLLGEAYAVGNFGRNGATLLAKGHNPYVKSEEFRKAVEFEPDVVIIDLGLNDTDPRNWPQYGEDFLSDYQRLISAFKTRQGGVPQSYVCLMTPILYGHSRFKSGTRDWFWQIQEAIGQAARNSGAHLVDLHTPLHAREELFADYLHPDATGAGIIARTLLGAITGDHGGFRLAPVFGEHMVFQQQKPVEIYGTSNTRDLIAVSLHHQRAEATAGPDGKWTITLPPLPAGGPYPLQIWVNGLLKVEWNDLLVGEVWFCSGQSNMEFELKGAENGVAEARQATDPHLRLFGYRGFIRTNDVAFDSLALQRINDLGYFEGSWQTCDPATAAEFSAIAYYFGQRLREKLEVPVGLVQVAVGGAPIEAFIDRKSLEFHPVLVDIFPNRAKNDFIFEWVRQRAARNSSLKSQPLQRHPYDPAYIFEAALEPLGSFPLRGVIWYQGESNAHNTDLYRIGFHALAGSWRNHWKDPQMPIIFAQLSSIDRPSWPRFRDMQRQLALEMPHTAMVVTSDLGDSLNVHPIRKKEVGDRMALQAFDKGYGFRLKAGDPAPVKTKTRPGQVILTCKPARKLKTSDGLPLAELEAAGEEAIFRPVTATLKGHKIWIPDPEGEIRAIRYGWKPYSRGNLVNEAGWPASTFLIRIE